MLRKTIQAFTLFALLSTPIASFSSEASVITGQKSHFNNLIEAQGLKQVIQAITRNDSDTFNKSFTHTTEIIQLKNGTTIMNIQKPEQRYSSHPPARRSKHSLIRHKQKPHQPLQQQHRNQSRRFISGMGENICTNNYLTKPEPSRHEDLTKKVRMGQYTRRTKSP